MAAWAWFIFTKMTAHVAFYAQTSRIQPVMRKIRSASLPALVLLGLVPFAQAQGIAAAPPAGAATAERAVAASRFDGISLDEAVSRAERQYHARVVRTSVQDEDGRKVYVLKLLSEDGRVFTVRIDAQSGRSR